MKGKRKLSAFRSWQTAVLCTLVAVILYFVLSYSVLDNRTIQAPIEVILPSDYKPTSIVPDSVKLVIQGNDDAIYMIDVNSIGLVADFSSVNREGVSSVPVTVDTSAFDNLVDLSDVTFYTNPSYVRIYFEK